MDTYALIAYIVAAICFALATLNGASTQPIVPGRVNLVTLGLLAWVSVAMVTSIRAY